MWQIIVVYPSHVISCHLTVPGIDGDWSPWSAWSVCTAECRQGRHRDCDSPPPSNGGHFCFGLSSEGQDCRGDLCRRTVWGEHSAAEEKQGEEEEERVTPATSEIALYVGLSLAVVVFLVVILVALSLLRRRRLPSGYRLTQSGESQTPNWS